MMTPADCPDEPALYAQQLNEAGRYADALAVCEYILAREPAHCAARFAQGYALFLLEQLDEAQTVLDALTADAPAFPNAAWLRAGLLRRRHGDHCADLLPAYDLVLCHDPGNLYAQAERADLLRAAGRTAEARDVFARIAAPDICDDEALRVEAAFKLGLVCLVLNDIEAALFAFRAVLEVAPDYPDAQAMFDMTLTL